MKAKLTLNGKEYEVEVSEEQIKEIKKPKYKRWRAEKGEKYFYIGGSGNVYYQTECHDEYDDFFYAIGNYFKTEEEAEFRKKQLLYLRRYKDYLGDDLVTEDDWKNTNILKYCALYNYSCKQIEIYSYYDQKFQSAIYSKSKEKIENFINLIGEDNFKKYILEVED